MFNDPINLTDPSGFAADSDHTGQAIGTTAFVVGVPMSGPIYALAQSAGAWRCLPSALAGQLATTGLGGLPGAASSGGSATVAAPTSAPRANPGAPKGMDAKSQMSPLDSLPTPAEARAELGIQGADERKSFLPAKWLEKA